MLARIRIECIPRLLCFSSIFCGNGIVRQNVDMTKWELPDGVSTKDARSAATVAGRGDGQMNGINSSSSHPAGPPHHTPTTSSPHLQLYIGAHDYLVMAAAASPSLPYQPAEVGNRGTTRGPAVSDSSSRISTSVDFQYGKVEVRAKVATGGISGFWLGPSEERIDGQTPCARVAIAEVGVGRCAYYELNSERLLPTTVQMSCLRGCTLL